MFKFYLTALAMFFCSNLIALPITEDTLAKAKGFWGPGGGSSNWGWAFQFSKKGKMEFHFVGEGSNQLKGKYTINGDKVFIEALSSNPQDELNLLKNRKYQCSLTEEKESLIFQLKLECDNQLTLFGSAFKSVEDKRIVQNTPVFTMGRKRAILTDNAVYRSNPNTSGKPISCKFITLEHKPSTYIPKERIVHVLARTEKKEAVSKWNNYWYYVSVMYDPHDGESCEEDYGWIFAEFTKWDKYQDY